MNRTLCYPTAVPLDTSPDKLVARPEKEERICDEQPYSSP